MVNRREVVGSLSTAGLAALQLGASSPSAAAQQLPAGAKVPGFEFLYECTVTLAPTLQFGRTVEGTRRIIPITGGSFQGPRLSGEVLAGGADWNLARTDGAGSVDASYYLRTHDGVLIRITNRGVGAGGPPKQQSGPERFLMFTTPRFEAPIGPYDWLNRGSYVGTLGVRVDVHDAVLIRVFELV